MNEVADNAVQEGSQGSEAAETAVTIGSQPAKQSLGDALRAAYAEQQAKAAPESDDLPDDKPAPVTAAAGNKDSGDAEPQTEVIRAPEHWSKEDRAAFDALDDTGRKTLLGIHKNMESGLTRKMEDLAQRQKRYKGFDEFFDTFHGLYPQTERTQFESQVVQALPNVMNTYLRLQQNPVETLEYLAQAYNVADKLSDALIGRDEGERSLKAKNLELEDRQKMLQMQQTREKLQAVERQIADFKEAKADDGALKHPYFDELEPVMSQLVQANPSLTLDQAYEKAYRQEKHDEILEKEREKVRREMDEDRRRKAKALRSQPRSGGRTGASVTPDNGKALSLRDELKANLMAQLETQGA